MSQAENNDDRKSTASDTTPPSLRKTDVTCTDTITPIRPFPNAAMAAGRMTSLISSSPRDDSYLNGLAHAYFRGMSAPEAHTAFSDDDADIPSDIDSNEPSEPLGNGYGHKDTSESGFIDGSSALKGHTDEEGTDSNRSGNSGSDDSEGKPAAADDVILQPCDGVKLQTLDTTKVAVAQVVDDDKDDEAAAEKPESAAGVPNIQQVLFTLHQQQMFQLHILQQIQQQVTKYSAVPTGGDDVRDMAGAMGGVMPWMKGFPAQAPTGGSEISSAGVDDVSDASAESLTRNDDFQDENQLNESDINEGGCSLFAFFHSQFAAFAQ